MANNPFGSFEDTFEQGISQVTNQVKKQVSDTASTATAQVTSTTLSDTSHASFADVSALNIVPTSDQFNETNTQQQDPIGPAAHQSPALDPAQMASLEANSAHEQQAKLEQTRAQLKAHKEQHKVVYFDPTFNPPKKEQPVADRLEQEKQEEDQKKMQQIEEQKKKDEPIALSRAKRTTEMNRGASG